MPECGTIEHPSRGKKKKKKPKQEKLKKKSQAERQQNTEPASMSGADRGSWTNTAVSRKREIMQRETLCPAQETRAGVETKTELRKKWYPNPGITPT